MIAKIISFVVVVLALAAGAAYGATRLASANGTDVCVNQTNGLMRASSTCRDSEYAMTIGGGSDVVVTSSGTVPVALGTSSTPVTLPLTGLTVTGVCARAGAPVPPYSPDSATARIVFSAPNGMDAVSSSPKPGGLGTAGTIGGTTLSLSIQGAYEVGQVHFGQGSTIATANDATATIEYGVQVSEPGKACTFLWQATEAPH